MPPLCGLLVLLAAAPPPRAARPADLAAAVRRQLRRDNDDYGAAPRRRADAPFQPAAAPPPPDMAPAKGARVHRMRAKGRLCQRHVLLPEGPKYDGGGRWYVPEHRLVARHLYDVTPRPRLLLPRCCNCCEKSALGCQ